MSTFRVSAAGLLRLATEGSLADRVAEEVRMSGHGVSPSERNSWSRSLFILAQDLADAGLEAVEVLVEYQLPLTSRRVDAVLAGVHPKTGAANTVAVVFDRPDVGAGLGRLLAGHQMLPRVVAAPIPLPPPRRAVAVLFFRVDGMTQPVINIGAARLAQGNTPALQRGQRQQRQPVQHESTLRTAPRGRPRRPALADRRRTSPTSPVTAFAGTPPEQAGLPGSITAMSGHPAVPGAPSQ